MTFIPRIVFVNSIRRMHKQQPLSLIAKSKLTTSEVCRLLINKHHTGIVAVKSMMALFTLRYKNKVVMKTTTKKLELTISNEELEVMTKEVKETVAFDYSKHKNFTSIDLWNIQRQRKQTLVRRNYV